MNEQTNTSYGFAECSPKTVTADCTRRLEKEWMLLTAGTAAQGVGTMTVNWGAFGYLWHRDLAMVVVRKSRNTLPLIESTGAFSLALFDESHREQLSYCGKISGKHEDKIARCQFTTLFSDGVPYFAEAHTVLICRVMYAGELDKAGFIERNILEEWYAKGVHNGDMHRMFLASIEKVLRKN